MSFQQQIPLAGQEFRPQEQPPTPPDSSRDSSSDSSFDSWQPSINDNTRAQGECSCDCCSWGKTLITSTKGKLRRA